MCLRLVRNSMISYRGRTGKPLSRRSINRYVQVIRRMFSWGVGRELVPPSIAGALEHVEGLSRGRTSAPESRKVRPPPPEDVQAVLEVVTAHVAAMIQIQRLTAMRPSEVVAMRTRDIKVIPDSEWEYWPPDKNG